MKDTDLISERHRILSPFFDEKSRRLLAAAESRVIGHGGIGIVSKLTGVSRTTISTGLKELNHPDLIETNWIRKRGGGRKKAVEKLPAIEKELGKLIEPALRGEPDSPLMWTSKSLRKLSAELKLKGFNVSHKLVGEILKEKGFSLQANRKTDEGKSHPDRNAQFEYIHLKVKDFQENGQPVISVDAKKKELVGNFKNNGKEWHKAKEPDKVKVYDFLSDADGGGSNSSRSRLWKKGIQKLSDETGLVIDVCLFPPATSKWNKIEHRLFSYISQNWRGNPWVSYEVIVNLIASTKTERGLEVTCELDIKTYKTGIRIKDEDMKSINLEKHDFHGEWNYTIRPKNIIK